MANLGELSRIGFGCYRVSIESRKHYDALLHALNHGCNCIDTSSNYVEGKSEELIGAVLGEHPQFEPFVITKAGYVDGDNLRIMEELQSAGRASDGLVPLSETSKYSIHPDFLATQIQTSLRRLRRSSIDGFLLHNPEHYFDQPNGGTSQDEFYERIKQAFEFLEEQVSVGAIKFYGVSSNTFVGAADPLHSPSLRRLLEIARQVSELNHFKLVEFPFNLLETGALMPYEEDMNFLEACRAAGLVTFANRPLNAMRGHVSIRLATYEKEIKDLDEERDQRILRSCIDAIRRQMELRNVTDDVMELSVMRYFNYHWMQMDSPEVVESVFQRFFYPLLHKLYDGNIPHDDLCVFREFHEYASRYALRKMTNQADELRRQLVEQGIVTANDSRPLAVLACDYLLTAGVDHVLVGMRSKEYVDTLRPLF